MGADITEPAPLDTHGSVAESDYPLDEPPLRALWPMKTSPSGIERAIGEFSRRPNAEK